MAKLYLDARKVSYAPYNSSRLTQLLLTTSKKDMESYECYIRKVEVFSRELRRNVIAVRNKLYLRSESSNIQNQLEYEKIQRKYNQAELIIIDKIRHDMIVKRNKYLTKSATKPNNKLEGYASRIKECDRYTEDSKKNDGHSQQRIQELSQKAVTTANEIDDLYREIEEGQMQALVMRFEKPATRVSTIVPSRDEERKANGDLSSTSLLFPEIRIEQLPSIFTVHGGYVTSRLDTVAKIEERPRGEDDGDIPILLEDSEDSSTPT